MQKAQTIQKKSKSNNTSPFQKRGDGAAFIQPKLNIGKSDDKFEKEADQMADTITSRKTDPSAPFFTPAPHIQKLPTDLQKQEEEKLQETVSTPSESFVARKKTEDEEKQLMKKEEVIEELQKKEVDEKIEENNFLQKNNEPNVDEEPLSVQAKPDGTVGGSSSIQSGLNKSKGGGSPLPGKVKSQMESGFGTDFRNVRLHTDSNAVQMSRNIGAQAFTHGNDIYFNEGKYQPESDSGKHLLAHELTHTVQQGASVKEKKIQRLEDNDETEIKPPKDVTPINESNGEFTFRQGNYVTAYENPPSRNLRLPFINISDFKIRNSTLFNPPFSIPYGRDTNQINNWNTAINDSASRNLDNKISEATASGGYSRVDNEGDRIYFFKGKENQEFRIFGNREQLLNLAKIPTWDEQNNPVSFQVDHIVEHQLGGVDNVNNYELLEASANMSSGSSIAWEMNKKIKQAYDILSSSYYQHSGRAEKPILPIKPSRTNQYVNSFLDQRVSVSFLSSDFELETKSGMKDSFWSFNQISRGEHLHKIESLTGDEMRELGTEDDPAFFISPTGGIRLPIPEGDSYPVEDWLPRVNLLSRPDFINHRLQVEAYKAKDMERAQISASYPNMTWHLNQLTGAYIFYVDKEQTIQNALTGTGGVFQSLRLPGMSLIRIDYLDITNNGFVGIGKVLPDVPLISTADIDIVIDGNGVRLRKLFSSSEFNFPSPFEIQQTSLEVSFGTDGLGIEGRVNFAITNVGEGYIGAAASTGGGFELEGAFNFDSELFDPAEISVVYKDDSWTIGGEIGIPEGKVRGVKNALIIASYTENSFTATGNAELDVPGIERGTMTVNYGEEGFSIGGNFDLSSDIPGIKGGSVEARVSKEEGAEAYDLFASGTAQPDIPGIDTSLSVTYENGTLTIEGRAAYSRGMLSGNVAVGATNRAVDAEGLPAGEPGDRIRVYGGGDLTLQLTPWLRATAGVQFLPNGEIEIVGRIALPDTVDVFERKELRRNLFSIPTIEIPLFAIPLGPRSIGLVAQIDGGLTFVAGFGPGQLRDVYAEVTYNPDREDETLIHGHALFAIPADAGLTLSASLGLGVSVGIASLTGGIELAGTLGLEGEAAAEADLSWNPTTGIVLDAEGSITVNPKFIFDVNAFARATLGVGWFSISETWRHNLASFSWGPDIQFGILFPVHYEESQPFDIGFNDIEVIYPDLKVVDMAIGMARDIKDQIF